MLAISPARVANVVVLQLQSSLLWVYALWQSDLHMHDMFYDIDIDLRKCTHLEFMVSGRSTIDK